MCIYIQNTANKTEDDDEQTTACRILPLSSSNVEDEFSRNLSSSLRPSSSYTFDEDDSEMTGNDISMNNLQATPSSNSNNFARSFFNNTRRRMSSGIVLSYNFLKGASSTRRDST